MRRICLLAFLLGSFVWSAQSAGRISTNELVSACKVAASIKSIGSGQQYVNEVGQVGMCFGYLEGITDAHTSLASRLFCEPENVTVLQLAQIFVKYMADHPEDLHRSASEMVAKSLGKAFPCPAQQKP